MDDQVGEVKQKTDIVSIIGERIELKKAGRNYKANCPFHGEKTPSFMVSPELQIYKCFGCSRGGDVFTFLEEFEGMEFGEAITYLAERAGVKLVKFRGGEASEKEKLIDIHSQTSKFYQYFLLNHPAGKKALSYLVKDRGLKKETIEEFQIGYSPDEPYLLSKFLVGKKKLDPRDIERAGIGVARGTSVYDRFRGRVVFPLFDHRGNPVGFSGRVLPWGMKDTAKYINSPETPIYHKSKVLYGLNLTRNFIKKKGVAIIVEGELDAISSYQAGIKNVAAIKGSALTEDQVALLSRFAGKFILALDSDLAGDSAARRGINVAQKAGVEIKVAKIEGGKDPDEVARHDLESFKKSLINAVGVWDFLIDSTFKKYDSKMGEGKAKIMRELAPVLREIENKVLESHYAGILAKRLGVSVESVMEEIEKAAGAQAQTVSAKTDIAESEKDRNTILENRLLTLIFHLDPEILKKDSIQKVITSPLNLRIIEEFNKYIRGKKKIDIGVFANSLPPELFDGFASLIFTGPEAFSEEEEIYRKELDLVEKELKILRIRENLKVLSEKIRDLEEKGDKERLLKAQGKFKKLADSLSKNS